MDCHRMGDGLKTAKQWAKEKKVPVDVSNGTELWINGHHQASAYFYAADQVRDMTVAELAEKKAAAKAKRDDLKRRKAFSSHLKTALEWENLHMKLKDREDLQPTMYTTIRGRYFKNLYFPWLCPETEYWHEDDVMADPACIPVPIPEQHKIIKIPLEPIEAVVLDLETTGLDPRRDEILQIGLLDYKTGEILMDFYVKPEKVASWSDAQAINHITPGMVAFAPFIDKVIPEISMILARASKIIGYNVQFDLAFLVVAGVRMPRGVQEIDVMQEFAPIYGEWSEQYGDYKFKSLSVCSTYYGYVWPDDGTPHDAIADCRATAHCYRKMTEMSMKLTCEVYLDGPDNRYFAILDNDTCFYILNTDDRRLVGNIVNDLRTGKTDPYSWDNGEDEPEKVYRRIYESYIESMVKKDHKVILLYSGLFEYNILPDEKIQIRDGCTRAEAKRQLKRGSLVLSPEGFVDYVMGAYADTPEEMLKDYGCTTAEELLYKSKYGTFSGGFTSVMDIGDTRSIIVDFVP